MLYVTAFILIAIVGFTAGIYHRRSHVSYTLLVVAGLACLVFLVPARDASLRVQSSCGKDLVCQDEGNATFWIVVLGMAILVAVTFLLGRITLDRLYRSQTVGRKKFR